MYGLVARSAYYVAMFLVIITWNETCRAQIMQCDSVVGRKIIQSLSGQEQFHGSPLIYSSQVENTNANGIYRYTYCIKNKHPHIPVIVLWRKKTTTSESVFSGFVAQQDEIVQYIDLLESSEIANLDLMFGQSDGEYNNSWEFYKNVESVFKKKSSIAFYNLIDFDKSEQNLDRTYIPNLLNDKEALKNFLREGRTIILSSGAIIDVLANHHERLVGGDSSSVDSQEDSKFIKVEIKFQSLLQLTSAGFDIVNRGTYSALDEREFSAAEAIRGVRFAVTAIAPGSDDSDRLGVVKEFEAKPFKLNQPKKEWLFAFQHFDGAGGLQQVRSEVQISDEGGGIIARFPISILSPMITCCN